MHFANCCCFIHYTLTENLRLCTSAEAGLFLNFEQKFCLTNLSEYKVLAGYANVLFLA